MYKKVCILVSLNHYGLTLHCCLQEALFENGSSLQFSPLSADICSAENNSLQNFSDLVAKNDSDHFSIPSNVFSGIVNGKIDPCLQKNGYRPVASDSFDTINKDGLQSEDSFGRWMTSVITDSPDSVLTGDQNLESSISTNQETSASVDHFNPSISKQIFSITDVSPTSALTTEETKVLFFNIYTLPLVDTFRLILRSNFYIC